jgi:hypothetical protein
LRLYARNALVSGYERLLNNRASAHQRVSGSSFVRRLFGFYALADNVIAQVRGGDSTWISPANVLKMFDERIHADVTPPPSATP